VRKIWQALRKLYLKIFPRYRRIELAFVHYDSKGRADKLIAEGWTIAKEEDTNGAIGWVYLERRERITS
jgi:hypothetical protein